MQVIGIAGHRNSEERYPMNASSDSAGYAQPLLMRVLVRPSVYRHPRACGRVCLAAGL